MIGSRTLDIKTPLQLTTLVDVTPVNVMGASCDLFDVSMDDVSIYLGKCRSHSLMQFPVVKGSFTTVKVPRVTAPKL